MIVDVMGGQFDVSLGRYWDVEPGKVEGQNGYWEMRRFQRRFGKLKILREKL
jgi:hypothetical protein